MSYFDSETDLNSDFEAIPNGRYQAIITKIELRETKKKRDGLAQKGELFNVTFAILSDKYANRQVFGNYNMQNDNLQAEQIGRGEFARLTVAAGVKLKIDDPGAVGFNQRKERLETQLQPLIDSVVLIETEQRQGFDGKTRAEVKKVLAKDAPPAAKTRAATVGIVEDDIPF
jgi:hypothetical protein